jgi:peptidoglycan/xylan/chitin deacetylase (PgdA/CDA1 family)
VKPAVDPPLLAFDATEWFHDPDWAAHVTRRHWRRLPARADAAIGAALAACERHGARATWFVGEAVARRWPALLRRLVDAGHEVASSGHEPVDLDAVPTAESAAIAAGWARARTAIEAATGRRVRGFRAPWPARGPGWWHESLRAAGYDYEVDADGWVRRLDGRGDPAAGARVGCRAAAGGPTKRGSWVRQRGWRRACGAAPASRSAPGSASALMTCVEQPAAMVVAAITGHHRQAILVAGPRQSSVPGCGSPWWCR